MFTSIDFIECEGEEMCVNIISHVEKCVKDEGKLDNILFLLLR